MEKKRVKNVVRIAFAHAKEITPKAIWGTPDMTIVSAHKSHVPEFPVALFGAYADWLSCAAKSKSAPTDYVAVALLSVASSLISNKRQGSPWRDWVEPTILWGALVGSPSSGKSPALDILRDPLRTMEVAMAEEFQDEFKQFAVSKEQAAMHKEVWQQACRIAAKRGEELPAMPEEASEPPTPNRPRITVNDITIEKAAEVASQNPHGICLIRDELAGLLANLERQGGSDREFYLESYGGRKYAVDRKKHPEPITIDRLSIAILGTIQPEKLSKLLSQTEDDGFAARFLYCWPAPVVFQEPDQKLDRVYLLRGLQRLHDLQIDEGKPIILMLSKDAKKKFVNWRRKSFAMLEKGEQGIVVSFIGKMPGTVIRLATTLVYLDWSAGVLKQEPKQIDLQYVRRAIKLVESYFIPMAKRCLGEHAVPRRQADACIMAKWIQKLEAETVNARQMRRKRVLPTNDVERYEAALNFLIGLGWIRPMEARDGEVGRLQKTYRVNPHLF